MAETREGPEPSAWVAEVDWHDGRGWIRAPRIYTTQAPADESWRKAVASVPGSEGRTLGLYTLEAAYEIAARALEEGASGLAGIIDDAGATYTTGHTLVECYREAANYLRSLPTTGQEGE